MRMTWNLGVVRLKFRVEDGGFELHRKVPYDYDSEFQDLYMKIAVALVEGHINVHEALIFQSETKKGEHTARIGWFLRDAPGRILLYPWEAATCAVIFFGGDWMDAGVAAICGLVAGTAEYLLGFFGSEAKILTDVIVGTTTGIIAGLFYRFDGERVCLSAIFLGTLYWFFYGTAFVIGILEIIAGELETGVTRFVAVSVKTFVLSLGASFGMLIVLENSSQVWQDQSANCGTIDLDAQWWRIPLYLACSASALAQYRFPIVNYWRGLIVQLVGYEVQYQVQLYFQDNSDSTNVDSAASNVLGAMAAVIAACTLRDVVDRLRHYYFARLLHRLEGDPTACGNFWYYFTAGAVRLGTLIGLGRSSDLLSLRMEQKLRQQTEELRDPMHPRQEIKLEPQEEKMLVETIVSAENLNIWAILMPAVYQLVPGSIIAKLWFNSIFPPPLLQEEAQIPGTNLTYTTFAIDSSQENVFANLMVISTSLALGLMLGFGVFNLLERLFCVCSCLFSGADEEEVEGRLKRERELQAGMYTAPITDEDDPEEDLSHIIASGRTSNHNLATVSEGAEDDGDEGKEESSPAPVTTDGIYEDIVAA